MKQFIFCLCMISAMLEPLPVLAQQDPELPPERVYIKAEIKGLACPYCAFGMEKALKEIAGVNEVEIELKKGLAYLSTPIDQQPTEKALAQIIKEAGFTPGKIVFSDRPFELKKGKRKK